MAVPWILNAHKMHHLGRFMHLAQILQFVTVKLKIKVFLIDY